MNRFIASLLLLLAVACTGRKTVAPAEVLVSFYPMEILTLAVTEGIPQLRPAVLIPAVGGCPHDTTLPTDSILAVVSDKNITKIGPLDDVGRSALQDHLYTAGELLRMNQLTLEHSFLAVK